MTAKRVNSDTLNLRREPKVSHGNIIAALPKAQSVLLVDEEVNGWVQVRTLVKDQKLEGYVSAQHLRDPVGEAQEKLVEAAVQEWLRFDRGAGKEHHAPYYDYVGEMWRAIKLNLDGKDRDQPWSAAFISWVVRNAGDPYQGFKHAAAHARYIHDAIKKRVAGDAAPFWGFRPAEHKVQIGDIVCQWRVQPRTYEDAAAHDGFFSHCDIVVELNEGRVRALGGNVNDTVAFKTYARDAYGHLLPENKVFAVLRNNTALA